LLRCCPPSDFIIECRHATINALTKTCYYSSGGALVTSRRLPLQRFAMVGCFAKQKQQLHHQQLTHGSTILFTFTFPVNLDLFNYLQYLLDQF
jgi:hypothetical protein